MHTNNNRTNVCEILKAVNQREIMGDACPWSRLVSSAESVKVVPYMDTSTSVDSLMTTSMVSEGKREQTSLKAAPPRDVYSHEFASIREFLARPYEFLGNETWSAGASGLLQGFSIASVLTGNQAWMNKIAGYELVRGTFCCKLTINANPFQQGKLIMHYIPCYSSSPSFASLNLDLIQATLHPNVELDCRETECTLRVPYITPVDYYDLSTNTTPYDWGTVFIDVLSKLLVGSGATSTTVQYSVWTWFEDFEVAAPIMVVPFSDSSRESSKMSNRPISGALSAVSKAANALTAIPPISSVAGSVGWAAGVASGIAAAAGYSKPDLNDSITLVSDLGNRYSAVADGPDLAIPMTLSTLNEVTTDAALTGVGVDETSFNYLKKKRCLYYELLWTENVTGNLTGFDVIPSEFTVPHVIVGTGHSIGTTIDCPSTYLSRFFQFYRGGYKLTLKFAKTIFHTGRLEVIFTPGTSTVAGLDAVKNLGTMRTVFDIRTTDEISFDIPYLLTKPWASLTTKLGTITVNVINALKAPETVSSTVNMLWYVEAADDFQLSVPYPSTAFPPVAIVPYMDSLPEQDLGNQNLPKETLVESARSIGECFTNVKQLMKRYCVGTSKADYGVPQSINPHFFEAVSMNLATGALTYPNSDYGPIARIAAMYAFYKGTMRVGQKATGDGVYTDAPEIYGTMNLQYHQYSTSTGAAVGNWLPKNWGTPGTYAIAPLQPSVVVKGNIQYARVPYYVPTKFSVVQSSYTDTLPTTLDQPNMFANMVLYDNYPPSSNVSFWVSKAVGDDFQMGFFIATPPVIQSYT